MDSLLLHAMRTCDRCHEVLSDEPLYPGITCLQYHSNTYNLHVYYAYILGLVVFLAASKRARRAADIARIRIILGGDQNFTSVGIYEIGTTSSMVKDVENM